ncbi:hypothetical protein Kpol_473p13 [Vanderwaltozyma polyspora DSM 70294]|uniref:AN1-type domain-containing protein n=1 Tax=Vanderwaltozyma polyspora (strain ATCC 22028 / DSM 70294 / BCRC 21397 / CBS 2163 / NBRC 10782 / NRRL Y-8283 / UCD 57-17) TaxID=436907 RepID=A7TQ05_VANPO|nr:uncharacterized protein Kpol_473p13 [Vanderwaltozyma polyspora DSM 70294]EDO15654.1 hypothetical protein Kpol_473p13 [Vanderwaltozyma polyspora DSM 70294]
MDAKPTPVQAGQRSLTPVAIGSSNTSPSSSSSSPNEIENPSYQRNCRKNPTIQDINNLDSSSISEIIPLSRQNSDNSTLSTKLKNKVIKTSTGGKKKKKKSQCYYGNCTSSHLKLIGFCDYCSGNYCSKHRLLENHQCKGLSTCKEQLRKRNADKLESEQTIIPKIQI